MANQWNGNYIDDVVLLSDFGKSGYFKGGADRAENVNDLFKKSGESAFSL